MKIDLPKFNASRIVCLIGFLTLSNLSGICQNVTLTEKKVNLIVRDLQICDAVTIERDILRAYNSSIISQLNASIEEKQKLVIDRDKYKKKTKRRGKIITVFVIKTIIETAIILL